MVLDPQQAFWLNKNLYFCKMFIKKITKPDRTGNKAYTYYRLAHSYKIGNKNRQQTILNLGTLETTPKDKHKLLADRIESIILGEKDLLFSLPPEIEDIAKGFAMKIIEKGVFPIRKKQSPIAISKDIGEEFMAVNIKSQKELESKSIGGEWLVKQTFNKFGLNDLFLSIGMSENQAGIAQMLLTAKMLHPSSELEAERWLLGELMDLKELSQLNMKFDLRKNKAAFIILKLFIENSNKKKARIFTFGIGNEINTHLLDKITEITKSTRSYISPDEDIEIKYRRVVCGVDPSALDQGAAESYVREYCADAHDDHDHGDEPELFRL